MPCSLGSWVQWRADCKEKVTVEGDSEATDSQKSFSGMSITIDAMGCSGGDGNPFLHF